MLALAAAVPDYVLAVHILAVVIAFGAMFGYPLMFADCPSRPIRP